MQRGAIRLNRRRLSPRVVREAPIIFILALCAIMSIVTTVGIVVILLSEAIPFFTEVSFWEFVTGKDWSPLFTPQSFGVLPLLSATAFIAAMALAVAFPIGLLTAIYLSEYAPEALRAVVKPVLEVLAGIPTVVFGFFAVYFISPSIIKTLFQTDATYNAITAACAMGVMLIPMVVSLSDDAMRAVPSALREGAQALGANRFQVAVRVVVPRGPIGYRRGGASGPVKGRGGDDDRHHSGRQCSQSLWQSLRGHADHDRLYHRRGAGRYGTGSD